MKVLIVDDSPLIVKKFEELLKEFKEITHLTTCGTYAHAVAILEDLKPDLAILDIDLPDKSGIDLVRYLKDNKFATTIIMCTNQSDDYYKAWSKKLGADFFIDKSKEFEKLPLLIASLFH
ncbi:response regulator [Segetibacter koreensis]|uniref:response regulator n=1 Tax=Segetibacter koreensis TaxID=398037 RepID=UPI00037C08C9|nr:response regulator [Segetibacter koreensis]